MKESRWTFPPRDPLPSTTASLCSALSGECFRVRSCTLLRRLHSRGENTPFGLYLSSLPPRFKLANPFLGCPKGRFPPLNQAFCRRPPEFPCWFDATPPILNVTRDFMKCPLSHSGALYRIVNFPRAIYPSTSYHGALIPPKYSLPGKWILLKAYFLATSAAECS